MRINCTNYGADFINYENRQRAYETTCSATKLRVLAAARTNDYGRV